MKTTIEYADEVSNPLAAVEIATGKRGFFCEKPDPEGTCKKCWAEALNKRFYNGLAYDRANRDKIYWVKHEQEMARLARLNARKLQSVKFPGNPLIVFTNDTYDLFQPSITDELRDWVFDNYDGFTDLTILIQSTYVSRMRRYLYRRYPTGMPAQYFVGMSVGNQPFLDANYQHLVAIPAKRRYLIFEPLLDEVNLTRHLNSGFAVINKTRQVGFSDSLLNFRHADISQLIIGGESGTGPRECCVDHIRSLVQQGRAAGIAILVKQMGSRPVVMVKDSVSGIPIPIRLKLKNSKGGDMNEFPPDLRIREFASLEVQA